MNTNIPTPINPRPETETLEQVLAELEMHGMPSLSKSTGLSKGEPYWWCCVDVFVNGEGVTFEVRQSGSPTPLQAARGARDKLHAAIKAVNEAGKVK